MACYLEQKRAGNHREEWWRSSEVKGCWCLEKQQWAGLKLQKLEVVKLQLEQLVLELVLKNPHQKQRALDEAEL